MPKGKIRSCGMIFMVKDFAILNDKTVFNHCQESQKLLDKIYGLKKAIDEISGISGIERKNLLSDKSKVKTKYNFTIKRYYLNIIKKLKENYDTIFIAKHQLKYQSVKRFVVLMENNGLKVVKCDFFEMQIEEYEQPKFSLTDYHKMAKKLSQQGRLTQKLLKND